MTALNVAISKFTKLKMLERVLVVVVVAITLYFIADIALLGPQQHKLKELQQLDKAHQAELASIEMNVSTRIEQTSTDQAALDELKKQIADVHAFFGPTDATTSEVGALLRKLLDTSPGLTLVSLKTLPVEPFFLSENKVNGNNKAGKEISPNETTEFQKALYKHGVEVSVKGNYMALLTYMESLHKYPKRLFWAEASLDVNPYPNSVLKLVIYTLSDQPSTPLR